MREYIRHPFDVTIRYTVGTVVTDNESLKDISAGGLCFGSPVPLAPGSKIHIEIPVQEPPFTADGIVAWCRKRDGYEVGVQFADTNKDYSLRMVEQVCHIKHYQQEVLAQEGRQLSSNEAALEWIEKYAKIFPR